MAGVHGATTRLGRPLKLLPLGGARYSPRGREMRSELGKSSRRLHAGNGHERKETEGPAQSSRD